MGIKSLTSRVLSGRGLNLDFAWRSTWWRFWSSTSQPCRPSPTGTSVARPTAAETCPGMDRATASTPPAVSMTQRVFAVNKDTAHSRSWPSEGASTSSCEGSASMRWSEPR
ncbi:hypothetical protein F0U62_03255 [Cystobacter fuscus]|nr:hypothetical protein F0U62_03255 [Cystobacter fuscus]